MYSLLFLIHFLNGPFFNILLIKIPILLLQAASSFTARDILQIIVEVRFTHLYNTAQPSFSSRKLLTSSVTLGVHFLVRLMYLFAFSPKPWCPHGSLQHLGPARGPGHCFISPGLGLEHLMQNTNPSSGRYTSRYQSWEHLWAAYILKAPVLLGFFFHVKSSHTSAL